MKNTIKRLITLLMALCIFACNAESVYDAVQMNDTLASITETYGSLEPAGEYLAAGDALLSFYESGRLQAKGRVYADVSEVAALTEGSFADAVKLRQGVPLSKLTGILGEGTEIMYINIADEDDAGTRRVLAWKDAAGTVLEALVELDDGDWHLFAITELPAAR